ncbi:MAG TPA: Fic family protein [Saprospiraceae bacterium]|nr:Fic family protein [Saprospiraceae bacterium]
MEKVIRLWKPVKLEQAWLDCDTSLLDNITPSWFERRKKLSENSKEYKDFLERLKREHAIETGIVERLYDLNKSITETFIEEGFEKSYLSHGDTNILEDDLMAFLKDHSDSVDFVFDVVKEERPLSTSFINQLHQLVTRSQKYIEGRNALGQKTKTTLLKGKYKEMENNPTREDGTKVLYCSPDHVSSEMDNLIRIYNSNADSVNPLILATWFHHAFTTIHPYQDGNGRVARLLTSLIFIKHRFFPFTVLRKEAKVKYIKALEKADNGYPQDLVNYFAEVQIRNIQKALNLKEITSVSLEEVQDIFAKKVEQLRSEKVGKAQEILTKRRNEVFKYCSHILNQLMQNLKEKLNGNADVSLASCSFDKPEKQHYFYRQIVGYAKKHQYFFNRSYPKAWLLLMIEMEKTKRYQLGISIHHFGYDDTTLAIGSFLEYKGSEEEEEMDTTLPLEIKPFVISVSDDLESKQKSIKEYLEHALTISLGHIANQM